MPDASGAPALHSVAQFGVAPTLRNLQRRPGPSPDNRTLVDGGPPHARLRSTRFRPTRPRQRPRLEREIWRDDEGHPHPILAQYDGPSEPTFGIDALINLQSLGLIGLEPSTAIASDGSPSMILVFGERVHRLSNATRPDARVEVPTGGVLLTDVGRPLAPLAGGRESPNEEYRVATVARWRRSGLQVVEL